MDPQLQQIYESTSHDLARSRMEPYRELILRWRRQGKSYRRIQQLLADHFSLKVGRMPLYRFILRRVKPRQPEREAETLPVRAPESEPVAQQSLFQRRPRRSPEEIAAMRQAASVENHKPAFPIKEDTREVFYYDASKPLSNRPPVKEK